MFDRREEATLFPTRVWTFDVTANEKLNTELCALIDDRSKTLPTHPRGERTGWQSDQTFFDWSEAAGFLRHTIAKAITSLHPSLARLDGMHLVGWANQLTRGDFFTPHTHSGSAWSGVYWADAAASSPERGGMFTVRDPRSGANMVETGLARFDSACTAELQPVTGQLLVFPSWLLHWVSPYDGDGKRVSISFNAS